MRLLQLSFLFVLSSFTASWSEMGHMLTARIAQYKLVDLGLDSDAYIWAIENLALLQSTAGEGNYPFVECAGWADKIKVLGVGEFNPWHYVDTPYKSNYSGPILNDDPYNITTQLVSIFRTLSSNPMEKPGRGKAILGKSWMIRMGIHFFGDLHTPHHCNNRYSEQFPKGDDGANAFQVIFKGKKTNLHSVWDSLFNVVPALSSPLTESTYFNVTAIAKDLLNRYGSNDHLADTLNFDQLSDFAAVAAESFQWAANTSYVGPEYNQPLSDEYIARASEVPLKRIHAGGLRLAKYLSTAYRRQLQGVHNIQEPDRHTPQEPEAPQESVEETPARGVVRE